MKLFSFITKMVVVTMLLPLSFAVCASAQKTSQSTPLEGSFAGLSGDGFMEMIFSGNILETKLNGVSVARGSFSYTNNVLTWNLTHAHIPRRTSRVSSGAFESLGTLTNEYRWIKIPIVKTVTTWDYKLIGDELFLSNYESVAVAFGTETIMSVPGDFPPLTRNNPNISDFVIWTRLPPYATTIIGGYGGYGGNVSIPAIIRGIPVVSIGPSSFESRAITQLQLSNNVKFIDAEAFSLNFLTRIDIPDGILLIGNKAFYKNQISEVVIGEGVRVIGAGAFAENPVRKITVKSTDLLIFDSAFDTNFKSAFLRYGAGIYSYDNGTWSFTGI